MTKSQSPVKKAEAPYDIRERTFLFATRIVRLVSSLPRSVAARELRRQLLRSGTSIGANVEEADAGESKRDFVHKMSIARNEARETRYWLRLLQVACNDAKEIPELLDEGDQLVRILSTIIRNARRSEEPEAEPGGDSSQTQPREC